MQTPVFVHGWSTPEGVFDDFESGWGEKHTIEGKEQIEILFGSYSYESYSGDAFVLFRDNRDGKLYEVNGGHCSCYGLEGQWNPEEVVISELHHRLTEGRFGRNDYSGNEFADVLLTLVNELMLSEVA